MPNKYLEQIRKQNQAIGWAQSNLQQVENQMEEYDRELSVVVAQLKQKYGYDDIAEKIRKSKEYIAALSDQNQRSGARLVVSLVAQAMRANPDFALETAEQLEAEWDVETYMCGDITRANCAASFSSLDKLVSINEWWDDKAPKLQPNGLMWLYSEKPLGVRSDVGVGIPKKVWDDLEGFAAFMEGFIQKRAQEWAVDWVGSSDADAEKQRALFEELRKLYGESAE